MGIKVFCVKALKTNYIWILRDDTHNHTLVVDPSEATPVLEFLKKKNWKLDGILITHHHPDHVGGNIGLQDLYSCPVYGWHQDAHRIPAITHPINETTKLEWNGINARVLFIPGHTLGHVAYHFESEHLVFVGDTLFGMGCGRLFEGTPQQLLNSLNQLKSLPPDTKVYCGHEYTLENAKFAKDLMDHKTEFESRYRNVKSAREQNQSTVPFTIATEIHTNPFLNADDLGLKRKLNLEKASDLEVFTQLRKLKDNFVIS